MKKVFLFAAVALVALASCSSDELVGDPSPTVVTDPNPEAPSAILFSSAPKSITRATNEFTGADAAEKLGNMFVVSGYKGSQTTWDDTKNKIVSMKFFMETF